MKRLAVLAILALASASPAWSVPVYFNVFIDGFATDGTPITGHDMGYAGMTLSGPLTQTFHDGAPHGTGERPQIYFDKSYTVVAGGNPADDYVIGDAHRQAWGNASDPFPTDVLRFASDGTWQCIGVCQFQYTDFFDRPDLFADRGTYRLVATPLPAALPLFVGGLIGLAGLTWRRLRTIRSDRDSPSPT